MYACMHVCKYTMKVEYSPAVVICGIRVHSALTFPACGRQFWNLGNVAMKVLTVGDDGTIITGNGDPEMCQLCAG